jgi:long-chain acyl-CoA synthetase
MTQTVKPMEAIPNVYLERPWARNYEAGVPARLDYPDKTLHEYLTENARLFPDRPAIIFYNQVMTFRQLDRVAARFAAVLGELGMKKGDRLALLLPNTPQFVLAYYGALRAGVIVVPANPLYVEREIEHELRDSGAKAILTLSKFFPVVQAVRERTDLEHVIVTNIKEYFPKQLQVLFTLAKERKDGHRVTLPEDGKTYWLQQLLREAKPPAPRVQVSPDDVALLQYTGGTTGVAKGAILTHRNLLANQEMIRAWHKSTNTTAAGYNIYMGVVPLFHIYGMQTVMNAAITGGGAMVLTPKFEHKPVLEALQHHRPNYFPGVPTLYNALNNFESVKKYDLSSLDACISGAAPLPVEVKRRFEEITGARVLEGYGLTEASPVTHCNPLHGANKAGSIGMPFPDTDAMIVDPIEGNEIMPPGEIGELVIRGPQVMQGYWNREDETADALRDGWLHTGDIARMDEDGYFYIVDRKKDMIISGGLNVYPRDVEEVLYTHPAVKEAVALGLPDGRWGEAVCAYVVLKEGENATEAEIIQYCHSELAGFKVPKRVEFRDELPKTMVGKVLRRVLREEALGGQDGGGEGE